MTDSIQVIWEYLTVSGTPLNALVASRIWSPRAPKVWRNENAGIVYTMVDEGSRALPNSQPLIMFSCYGGKRQDGKDFSYDDARTVYRALVDRLREADGVSTTSGIILVCSLETAGQDTEDEDETDWPVVECQYRFTIE